MLKRGPRDREGRIKCGLLDRGEAIAIRTINYREESTVHPTEKGLLVLTISALPSKLNLFTLK